MKNKKKTSRKIRCRALIPLDTGKIRAKYLKNYRSRRKKLEKLECRLKEIQEQDEPEYQKFLARHFGTEQTRLRELEQSLQVCELKIEKIRFLASRRRIQPAVLCYRLSQKITPEHDFWYCLEEALNEWHEEEIKREQEDRRREEEERRERQARREQRKKKTGDEWDEQDIEDDFDDFLDSVFGEIFEDSDEDFEPDEDSAADYEDAANQFFDELFGFKVRPEEKNDDNRELKKLYRELCMLYHPDRTGSHDARMKRIWNEIQTAYQNGDLDRLRFFRFNAGADDEKKELTCSELQKLIFELEDSIIGLNADLKSAKYQPYFGFSSASGQQREMTVKILRQEFSKRISDSEQYLQKKEMLLENLLNGWKPGKKKVRKKRNYSGTDDLFGDIPF